MATRDKTPRSLWKRPRLWGVMGVAAVLLGAGAVTTTLRKYHVRLPRRLRVVVEVKGVNLSGADLSGSRFRGSDLRNADLQRAILCDVDFTDANLGGANLSGAVFDKLTRWPRGFDPTARGAIQISIGDPRPRQVVGAGGP